MNEEFKLLPGSLWKVKPGKLMCCSINTNVRALAVKIFSGNTLFMIIGSIQVLDSIQYVLLILGCGIEYTLMYHKEPTNIEAWWSVSIEQIT